MADCVIEHLTPIRTKLLYFIANPEYLVRVLEDGANKASKVATTTMQEVNSKLGIKPSDVCFKIYPKQKNVNVSYLKPIYFYLCYERLLQVTPGDKIFLGFEATGNAHLGDCLTSINECVRSQHLGKDVMLSIEDSMTSSVSYPTLTPLQLL